MVIKILDHVKSVSTYEDGNIIFELISTQLKNNNHVIISFSGIQSVPSAFINSAFIRLLDIFSFDKIKEYVKFSETTKHINDLIKSRFEFVTKLENTWKDGLFKINQTNLR